MYNKYKIDKKDMGYSVAIGEIHALIGNPSFYLFDTCSSRPFISEGSVDLYKYDAIKLNEFTYNRTIKRSSFKDQFVLYTEDNTTSSATQPANTGSHNLTTEANGSTSSEADLLINDARILKILESDFGRSVDICGNLGVIGSTKFVYTLLHCDDVIRSEEGVVEIHNLSDSGSLVSSIYPRDVTDISSSFDTGLNSFGWSVSINNNFVAVGSPYTNTSGSVFIFKSGSAGYQLHSRLTPDEPNTLLYGSCLKLDKKFDRLVVGNGNVTSTGSKVYLYEYITSSNSWVKSNTFSSDREVENLNFISLPQHDVNLTQSAGFGNSVSIYCSSSSEITVAVGSPYDRIYKEYSGSDCYRNGCVYVFDLIHCQLSSSTTSYWKQTKLFGDSDAFKFNRFGHSVDIYDKNLIVSSPKYLSEFSSSYIQNTLLRSIDCDDISENDYLGMFYIYKNTDGDWNNVYSKYKPIKRYGYPYNFFAHDVCIFDENIIVGSPISITDKIGSVVCEIAAGYEHTVALKSDGTVVAWGKNDYGQTTVPAGLSGVIAIAAGGYHTVALKSDGTVVAWGYNEFGQTNVPAGLTNVTAIAAGGSHTVALKSDGSVRAWGGNFNFQSNVPDGLSGVVAIAAGNQHTVTLKQDGTVVTFTPISAGLGASTVPAGLSGVTAIAAGYEHTVALKSDGTVVAWGRNDYGQRNVPVGLSGVTAIAAGFLHTVALKNDGTVVAWGGDQFGQVTGTPDITSPYVGISNPVTIGGQTLNGVTSIAAGLNHTVALTTDYDLTIVAWGDNSYGQATIADTINHTKLESNSSIEILGNKPDNLEVVNGNFGIYNLSDFESHHHVGNVFYKTGKMVLSTNNSIFDEIFESDVSDEPVYDISYKSSEQLYEKEIICTVNVGEFNYSTNPTSYYRPTFLLDLNKNGRFDFDDCDKILRAVYRKFTSRESWWSLFPFQFTDSIIEVDEDVERSLFYYHLSSSFENKSHVSLVEEKLTDVEYTNIINTLDDALDINSDSISDDMDIRIIWKYFINRLDATTYNKFLTSKSVGERIQFTAVIDYLNQITGKKNLPTILDSFQTRWVSGSSNQTSSYLAPYVTTIGLYDGFNLIAVAKLGTPIKNEGYFPLNFIVRFDI